MRRLTSIRTPGDPEALLESKREHIDPVMKRKADQYGHLLHIAARGEDGLVGHQPLGERGGFAAGVGGPGNSGGP